MASSDSSFDIVSKVDMQEVKNADGLPFFVFEEMRQRTDEAE